MVAARPGSARPRSCGASPRAATSCGARATTSPCRSRSRRCATSGSPTGPRCSARSASACSRTATGPTRRRSTSSRTWPGASAAPAAVLVLTFRDDELALDHRLRAGRRLDPARGRGARSRWSRCRATAVAELAGRGRRGRAVRGHRRQPVPGDRGAGGGRRRVPPTVRDAVLARAARLAATARARARAGLGGARRAPSCGWSGARWATRAPRSPSASARGLLVVERRRRALPARAGAPRLPRVAVRRCAGSS